MPEHSFRRGDLVESLGGERGIICNTDPLVMRTTEFTSYVPLEAARLVERGVGDACIPEDVLARIRRYLEGTSEPASELATGCTGARSA